MSQAESIRNGIVSNLAPLLKSNGGPLGQVSAYMKSNPTAPCAEVGGGPIVYDRAMHRGLDEVAFTVTVLFPFTQDVSQQKILDQLRDATGATSVKTLIESDRTLGGACQDLHVTQATEPRLYDRQQGGIVLGCEWQIAVYP